MAHPLYDMVWVDLDDTLIDFRSASRAALLQLYDDESLLRFFPSPKEWENAYEVVNYMLWQRYSEATVSQADLRMLRFTLPLTEAGVHPCIAEKMARRLDPLYLQLLADGSTLLPGAVELLRAIHAAGLRTGIISNGFREVQHRKLAVTGLDTLIDMMVLSDDIGIQKPDPRIFNHAMQRAGCSDPSRMLMIGDNATTDIGGALGAGWQAILLDRALPLVHTAGPGYSIVSNLYAIPHLISI